MTDNIAEELLATPTEVEPTPAPEAEPDATQQEVEPEKGAEPEPEKEPEKVEPPSTDQPETVPMSAHIGLRKDFQKKIDELKAQLPTKEDEPAPSVFEDEQGAFKALKDDLTSQFANELLNEGEAEAVRQHDKDTVDKAVEWVTETVAESPFLAQQLANTPLLQRHRKVVELYQQEQTRAELENPDKLREQIRQEERAKLLAEQEAEKEKLEAKKQSIPKSLVGEPSAGGITSSGWSGPTDLEAVLGPGG